MLTDDMNFRQGVLQDTLFTLDAAASTAAEVDPAPHLAAGLLLGGDAQQLDASTRAFAKGSMKALVNLVSEVSSDTMSIHSRKVVLKRGSAPGFCPYLEAASDCA
jgi:hypothetical protein